jgi:glycosyltransferase involved in cell wall biosynthesis
MNTLLIDAADESLLGLAARPAMPAYRPVAPARGAGSDLPVDVAAAPSRVLLWHWGQAGAGAKITMELARELKALPGLEIEVSSARGSDLHRLAPTLGMPTHDVPTFEGNKSTLRGKAAAAVGLARLPLNAWGFRRMLAERRIDVALCTMQAIWDAATLPALAAGPTRSVLVLHDAFFHPGDEYPLRYAVLRRQIAAADAMIVLSDHVRRQAIEAYGYPAERIWQMPHAAFEFGSAEVRPAAHPRGARPLRLLFFGRIVGYKGLDHLLRAQRLLRERGVAVEVVVAGSGSLEPYAGLLEDLPGVEIHNRWLGDEEIAGFMAGADIAVLPYVEASQSGVAAAAYAAGRPVVATPIGGLAEQVVHGGTGLLARDMSVEALADTIHVLDRDPTLLDRLGAGALAHARGELSWRRSAEVVAEVVAAVRAMPRRRAAQG